MSASDCRQGRCACATKASVLHESARTVRQSQEWGHRDDTGALVWTMRAPMTSMVTPVWAKHIEARLSDPEWFIERRDGWLVYRCNPHVPEVADWAVGRIRWDETAERVPGLFGVTA